jgi:predicted TIM-barrel enzyme
MGEKTAQLSKRITLADIAVAISQLVQAINRPAWVSRTTSRGQVDAVVSSGTVTTVTGLTNIGGVSAYRSVQSMDRANWSQNVGRLIT